MKVNTENFDLISFENIKEGTLFKYNEDYYIKVCTVYDNGGDEELDKEYNCVNIYDGSFYYIDEENAVLPFLKAIINLMGE